MAGFGRTGKWFGRDNWDVVPDILTVAKGINSGYVPLGAMIVREPIAEWVRDKYFAGGLTYSGHPLACASAVASIEAFREEGIVENAAEMGDVFGEGCRAWPTGIRRSARCAGSAASGASSSSEEPRDARAARSVQRDRRGDRARCRVEGGARPRALPDDALERDHLGRAPRKSGREQFERENTTRGEEASIWEITAVK